MGTADSSSSKGLFRVAPWGGAWAGFGALSFASEFQDGQPKWWLLGALSAVWIAVCFKQILDLTRLKPGSSNERQMIVLNFGVGALVALLIAGGAYFYSAAYTMHLLGLYVIPSSAVLAALMTLIAWRMERKAKVRVFVGNRGWVYLASPSNPTPHTDARDTPAQSEGNGARAGGRER